MRRKRGFFKENKCFKHVICIVLACILFGGFLTPLAVFADTTQETRTVRIGYIAYEGFISQDENGEYQGYAVEYLNKIAEYTGWKYEYVYDTWENCLKGLEDGSIDFICHAQKTPEWEEKYLFSKYPDGSESCFLYVRKDDDRYYYNDYANFNGMKIAFLRDSFQNQEVTEYAAKKGFSYQATEYDTPQACFDALESGEVDGVAMGSLALKTQYKIVCKFGSDPFYFITGKQNQELMDELEDALGEIAATDASFGTNLFEKYYGVQNDAVNLVFTREESEFIQTADKIKIGLIPNRTPFSKIGKSGDPEGITVDLMKLIEERSGLKFDYEVMQTGQRATDYLEENPDAFVAGIMCENPQFHTEEYVVSDVMYSDDVSLVCRKGFSYNLDAPDETYKLVIPASYVALEEYIVDNYPQFEIVRGKTSADCMKMVLDGKADFMAQNVNVITPLMQNPHYEGLTLLPTFFMDEDMGIVGGNTDQNKMIINIMNKCIASISAKEKSQITINHTITNGYKPSASDLLYKFRYPVSVIVVLMVALAALMLIWQQSKRKSYVILEKKNAQLRDAVVQADHANQAKSQFLARMSHEIRTPMNAIVGLTEIAKHHDKEPEKIDEYLTKIEASSQVLLNIINDVLDMSAIESDKIQIAQNPFNIREILTSISTIYYTQCRQKGIHFEMDTADISDEQLLGDGLRLNQIFLNLVSNAYKFTPQGGEIRIVAKEVSVQGKTAYFNFSVADTGEGMTEEMQQRIFKPFEQESASTAQKHGGSGLGLSIAKNLVEMMEGSISFVSKKDVGTTFKVSIPFQIDTKAAKKETDTCKTIRALIVDNDMETGEYTALVLSRIGVDYELAKDASEALEKLNKAKGGEKAFQICFVDWKMQEQTGSEVIRKIRETFQKDMLIIIASAYDTSEIKDEALAAGADMFLTKPIFQSTVFNLLMKLFDGKCVKCTAQKDSYDFEGKKVLLAEDTDFNAEIAMELLDMVNMKVDHAENGEKAVEMFERAEEGTYAAILMDVQMPVMDGYEATRKIRASSHPQAKSIPIFAMTANAFTEDVSAALNAGMNGHIAKPIDTRILYSSLEEAINK